MGTSIFIKAAALVFNISILYQVRCQFRLNRNLRDLNKTPDNGLF